MKVVRIALCIMACAVFGTIAMAEDADIRALQAKLAAQEARLQDLQSRMQYNETSANANYGGAPEGIVSLNKNAVVTIGGNLNTRYFYHNGKVDSIVANPDDSSQNGTGGAYTRRAKANQSDLKIADAKVYLQIDVNDYFDAFIQMDLQSSDNNASDNAEKYYVRWKNICNTGFGIKVGRDALVFGEDHAVGILGNYAKNGEGAFSDAEWGGISTTWLNTQGGVFRAAGYGNSGIQGRHNYWDQGRIIQVTPYWEGLDGKLKAEVSIFQEAGNTEGRMSNARSDSAQYYLDGHTYKSRNYGTSVSARVGYEAIEGLKFSASVVNFQDNWKDGNYFNETYGFSNDSYAENNTAVDLAFSYRPAFFNRMKVWGQWVHGWNIDGLKDVDSDTISYGGSFDLNDSWTIFAQGDWLRTKDSYAGADDKAESWAAYAGIRYVLPYGVNLEAGWKHENAKWKRGGVKILKAKADTAYLHLGFDF